MYHSGDVSDGSDGTAVTPLEVNPILANDKLYICTPFNRIVALDPATGTEAWVHDPGLDKENTYSKGSYCRGVAYWSEGATGNREDSCNKRVLSGIGDGRLIAVDADTGRLCSDFGNNGQVDLNAFDYHGEGSISLTSPPAIYRDVVIVGSTILDGEWANAPDGIVRGLDVRSGRSYGTGTRYRNTCATPSALQTPGRRYLSTANAAGSFCRPAAPATTRMDCTGPKPSLTVMPWWRWMP